MKKNTFIFVVMMALLSGCGSSQQIAVSGARLNTQNTPGKKYNSIFLAVLTDRYAIKTAIEDNLANTITASGYRVVKSSEVFAPNFTPQNAPDKETLVNKIRKTGCDIIFTVAMVDEHSEIRCPADSIRYIPYAVYGGTFWGYYQYWYPRGYQPGYITPDKNYFIEGNLFDVRTGRIVWSIQTRVDNSLNLERSIEEYEAALWERLEKDFFKNQ